MVHNEDGQAANKKTKKKNKRKEEREGERAREACEDKWGKCWKQEERVSDKVAILKQRKKKKSGERRVAWLRRTAHTIPHAQRACEGVDLLVAKEAKTKTKTNKRRKGRTEE